MDRVAEILWTGWQHSHGLHGNNPVDWVAEIRGIRTQTPKATQLLEYVIMMAFLSYMMGYGHLVYPREFGALPPAWQAWLADPANAALFSAAYAIIAMFGLSLWNLIASGVPLWKPRTANAEAYPYVREASHSSPRLPTVKELADEHRQLYG